MAAVRQVGTAPELALRRALWSAGLRGYRIAPAVLPGRPDVVFPRWKIAIFVDGAFWHGHPSKFPGDRMSAYWVEKIRRNRARDRSNVRELTKLGWSVVRFWDFEIESEPLTVVRAVRRLIRPSLLAQRRARQGRART